MSLSHTPIVAIRDCTMIVKIAKFHHALGIQKGKRGPQDIY